VCGILGGLGSNSLEHTRNNIQFLDRRGPDTKGILDLKNGLTIGATRLAMTDPRPRSDQPMVNDINGDVIVFNGEIYNFKEIRKSLIEDGIKFVTESDTEVLLKALSFYGKRVIPKFEGMFAFVFVDKQKNRVVMSRDYLGKKPLYYFLNPSSFYFSSQISIVKKFLKNISLDFKSVATYLTVGYTVDKKTMFKNILAVEPGEIIEIDMSSLMILDQQTFIPDAIKQSSRSDIRASIKNSLDQRVHGHNSFALSMSGGVDSTILALESRQTGKPFIGYTMTWKDSGKNKYTQEAAVAAHVSKVIGIDHQVVDMPPVRYIPDILTNFINAMDEPNSNPTGLSMMVLYSKIAEDGHRLTITGDGADEVFGGYKRYDMSKKLKFPFEFKSNFMSNNLIKKNVKLKLLNKLNLGLIPKDSDEFWLYWHLVSGTKILHKLFPEMDKPYYNLLGLELNDYFFRNKTSSLMFRDLRTWLSMESNRRLDRISMWHSIEARSPFQSEKLIANGYQHMTSNEFRSTGKELLFNSFPELRQLPILKSKAGFISPLGYWLRSNPDLVEQTVQSIPNFLPINENELKIISQSPGKGDFQNFRTLWSLIVLDGWLKSQV
jgi:asparagine synthase (glutamine-hydrolysing)